MSAVPEVSLGVDEPIRCGFGGGGYGSQYAVAAGCALRVANRLHLNGALSYAPSVDYGYGSTPSVAGRFGFSFPLGGSFKSKGTTTATNYKELLQATASSPQEWKQYQIAVATNITQLQSALAERDEEIEALKGQHESEIKALKQQLEDRKRESAREDQQQNHLINSQQKQISSQQAAIQQQQKQISMQQTQLNAVQQRLNKILERIDVNN